MNLNLNTYSLFSRPYLDPYTQCYKNIVTINLFPKGPLQNLVKQVKFYPLSPFKQDYCNRETNCGLALCSLQQPNIMMTVDEVPILFSFLLANGYSIDTSITKMLNDSDIRFQTNNANKLICFITYT